MFRILAVLSVVALGACSGSDFAGVPTNDAKKEEQGKKVNAVADPAPVEKTDVGALDAADLSTEGTVDSQTDTGTTTDEGGNPTIGENGDDGSNSKMNYKIPENLTFFYKKYKGSTNYYGKVQASGKNSGAFYQIVCPGNTNPTEGSAIVRFNIKVGDIWTEFALGETITVDPKKPIYAKIVFDTNETGVGHEFHHADDETVDIRSYFGPHPEYPDVSIPIATPGAGADWPVGIGRGKDLTRHPATPDLTYKTPLPNCD